jgi:hypothetical protein
MEAKHRNRSAQRKKQGCPKTEIAVVEGKVNWRGERGDQAEDRGQGNEENGPER